VKSTGEPDTGPGRPGRRRLPLEFVLGAGALLICVGAVVGPKLYRAIVVRRMVADLGESLSSADRDALRALMDLDWPEADASITRLANRSPRVAYLPEKKALVSAAQGLKFTLSAPDGGFFNARAIECYVHGGGSFTGKVAGARVLALSPAGESLAVTFQLDEPVARKLNVGKDAELSATVTLVELRAIAGGGEAVMVDYDMKSSAEIWAEVLRGLDPLLRSAGIEVR